MPPGASRVEGRTGCGIDDFQVRVSIGEQNRIDLVYTAPGIQDAEEQSALNAAFVATETLLGEKCLDRWIGAIEITPLPRPKRLKALFGRKAIPRFVGLERLVDTVHAAIGSLRDQLPPNPHYEWAEDSRGPHGRRHGAALLVHRPRIDRCGQGHRRRPPPMDVDEQEE